MAQNEFKLSESNKELLIKKLSASDFYKNGEPLENAIKRFQTAAGLEATGKVDYRQFKLMTDYIDLRCANGKQPNVGNEYQGLTSNKDTVQILLGGLGYYTAGYGDHDKELSDAVKRFKEDVGLPSNGIITPQFLEVARGIYAIKSDRHHSTKITAEAEIRIRLALGRDLSPTELAKFHYHETDNATGKILKRVSELPGVDDAKALFASIGGGEMQHAEEAGVQSTLKKIQSGEKIVKS